MIMIIIDISFFVNPFVAWPNYDAISSLQGFSQDINWHYFCLFFKIVVVDMAKNIISGYSLLVIQMRR